MAGLLDLNDPQSMGLLSLGLRLMSTPGKFGAALGTAGMGALGDMQQAQARQQSAKQMDAAERMRALQEQMTMLQLAQAKQQQAAQGKRDSYLGSVSPSQGPAMPVDMAQALAAGLSPQEASALMPQSSGPEYKVVGSSLLQIGPQGVKEAFRAPDTGGDKDLALLEMIHGKGTPEFMRAAQQLAQKRTTHAPAASVSYGAPMAGTDAAGNPVFFQPAKGGGAPAIIPGVKPPAAKLGEKQANQNAGIDALSGAIDEYVAKLGTWRKEDALKPDKRADMGTFYNNVMLQAKEAYNLGVLNGPDLAILESVIQNPVSMIGTITSNEAMAKQAINLKRMMNKIKAAQSGGQKPASADGQIGDPSVNKNDPLGLR